MSDEMQKAIKILKTGGIVIFPTDTAFGIGCRIDNAEVVNRLFNIRKRPDHKASPVLVSSIEMVAQWVDEVPQHAHKLMQKHWPGGLTIVLKSSTDKVPSLVKGGTDTLGVRMPNHKEMLEIVAEVGVPILASSANFAGAKTPFSYEEIDPKLVKLADFVLSGECSVKEPSTVIDATVTPVKMLREGAVKLQE